MSVKLTFVNNFFFNITFMLICSVTRLIRKFLVFLVSNKKGIAYAVLLCNIFMGHAYGQPIYYSETSFYETPEAARAACSARAASFDYWPCGEMQDLRSRNYYAGGYWCSEGGFPQSPDFCRADYYFAHFYYPTYVLTSGYEVKPKQCLGNPIDPVTGAKIQYEPLIKIQGVQSLEFNLYYNSTSLNKWKHNFHRYLSFSDAPTGTRYDTNGDASIFYYLSLTLEKNILYMQS